MIPPSTLRRAGPRRLDTRYRSNPPPPRLRPWHCPELCTCFVAPSTPPTVRDARMERVRPLPAGVDVSTGWNAFLLSSSAVGTSADHTLHPSMHRRKTNTSSRRSVGVRTFAVGPCGLPFSALMGRYFFASQELGKSFREYGFAAIADHGLEQVRGSGVRSPWLSVMVRLPCSLTGLDRPSVPTSRVVFRAASGNEVPV